MQNIEELNEWWNTGRMVVDHPGGYAGIPDDELSLWIQSIESTYRLQLPADLPELDTPVAVWAFRQVVRAAQLTVYRELGDEFIAQGLEAFPSWIPNLQASATNTETPANFYATLPEHHYSVDLFFRFLPDLYRLTHVASPSDPLLSYLQHWATMWPLSGNGIAGTEFCDDAIRVVQSSPGLRVLYRERSTTRPHATIR